MDDTLIRVLGNSWKIKHSSKVLIIGWRMILNKLPTRVELARRGVVAEFHNLVFPICFIVNEDMDHLFYVVPYFEEGLTGCVRLAWSGFGFSSGIHGLFVKAFEFEVS
ncbi:unnamed protein product [Lathyrus oleraceus]|uniref:Reverse transcriptase zinc-binding domain-containing protein n=1 Tax=Pisum sativum TaxID=3888 RepID=A0A9D5BHM3_PEA|nr:hypothetical protein KIW84_012407 [Pisum sativum]